MYAQYRKEVLVIAIALALAPSIARADGLYLRKGAITCDEDYMIGMAASQPLPEARLVAIGCTAWADGTKVDAAEIPPGMEAGKIAVTINGKREWTLLSMLRQGR